MSEFNGITGFDGWSAKLKSLLEDAKLVAQQDELDKRLTMCDRLTDFVLESVRRRRFDRARSSTFAGYSCRTS